MTLIKVMTCSFLNYDLNQSDGLQCLDKVIMVDVIAFHLKFFSGSFSSS